VTGGVEAHPVTREGLAYIAANLRPRDRREIFALRWNDDEDQFVNDVFAYMGDLWRMWSLDGEPVAINGVVPVRPGVVICGAFGTSKWRKTIKHMTRWSLDYVIPVLKLSNFHRGEAYVLAANTDSRKWIELLGGEIEAVLRGYGKGHEDFLLYVWDLTQERIENVHRRRLSAKQQRPATATGADRGPAGPTNPRTQ
jgi:RimJ/RimL family protein N-acetyltransferase